MRRASAGKAVVDLPRESLSLSVCRLRKGSGPKKKEEVKLGGERAPGRSETAVGREARGKLSTPSLPFGSKRNCLRVESAILAVGEAACMSSRVIDFVEEWFWPAVPPQPRTQPAEPNTSIWPCLVNRPGLDLYAGPCEKPAGAYHRSFVLGRRPYAGSGRAEAACVRAATNGRRCHLATLHV